MQSVRRLFEGPTRTVPAGPGVPPAPRVWIVWSRGDDDIRFQHKKCRLPCAILLLSTILLVPALVISALVHTVRYQGAQYGRNVELYNDASADWSFESQFFLDAINVTGNQAFWPFIAGTGNVPLGPPRVFNLVLGQPDPLPHADLPPVASDESDSEQQFPTPRPYPQPATNVKLVLNPEDDAGSLIAPITGLSSPKNYAASSFLLGPVIFVADVKPSNSPRPSRTASTSPSPTESCWRYSRGCPNADDSKGGREGQLSEPERRRLQITASGTALPTTQSSTPSSTGSNRPTPSSSRTPNPTFSPSRSASPSWSASPWKLSFPSVFGATYSPLCPDPSQAPGSDPSCLTCPYGVLVAASSSNSPTPSASSARSSGSSTKTPSRSATSNPDFSPYCIAQVLAAGACIVVDPVTFAPAAGAPSGPGCALLPMLPDGQLLQPTSDSNLCPYPSLTNPNGLSTIQYTYENANANDGMGLQSWSFSNFTVEVRSAADPFPAALALTKGTLDFGAPPVATYDTAVALWIGALLTGAVFFLVAVCVLSRSVDSMVEKAQGFSRVLAVRQSFRERHSARQLQRTLVPPSAAIVGPTGAVTVATTGQPALFDNDREALLPPPDWVNFVAGANNERGATAPPAAVIARPLGRPLGAEPQPQANMMRQPLLGADSSVSDLSPSMRAADWNIGGSGSIGAAQQERAPSIDRQQAWIETVMQLPAPSHIPASRWNGLSAADREIALSESPDLQHRRMLESMRRHVLQTEESAFFGTQGRDAITTGNDVDAASRLAVAATAGAGNAAASVNAHLTVSDSYRRLLINGGSAGVDGTINTTNGPAFPSSRSRSSLARSCKGCLWRAQELLALLLVEFMGLVGYVQYAARSFVWAVWQHRCCCCRGRQTTGWTVNAFLLSGALAIASLGVQGSSYNSTLIISMPYDESSSGYGQDSWACAYRFSSSSSFNQLPQGGTTYGCSGPSSSSSSSSASLLYCAYAGHSSLVAADPRLGALTVLMSLSTILAPVAFASMILFIGSRRRNDRSCCGVNPYKLALGMYCAAVFFGAAALVIYYLDDLDEVASNALCNAVWQSYGDILPSSLRPQSYLPDFCAPFSKSAVTSPTSAGKTLEGGPQRFAIGLAVQAVGALAALFTLAFND